MMYLQLAIVVLTLRLAYSNQSYENEYLEKGVEFRIKETGLDERAIHCEDIRTDLQIQNFRIQSRPRLNRMCACTLRLTDPTEPISVTLTKSAHSFGFSPHIWSKNKQLAFVVQNDTIQFQNCDINYKQRAAVNFEFGGGESSIYLRCYELSDSQRFLRENQQDCHKQANDQHDVSDHPHSHRSTSHTVMALIIVGCIIVFLLLNLMLTLSIKFNLCTNNPTSHEIPHHNRTPRKAIYCRQHTNISHPYESILYETEEDLQRALQAYNESLDVPSRGAHNAPVVPYDVPRRAHDTTTGNVDLDMPVYPPSTCGSPVYSTNPHGYSYTYSTNEPLSGVSQDRKLSLQSNQSTTSLSNKALPRVQELALVLESSTSLDSGYAERRTSADNYAISKKLDDSSSYLDMNIVQTEDENECNADNNCNEDSNCNSETPGYVNDSVRSDISSLSGAKPKTKPKIQRNYIKVM